MSAVGGGAKKLVALTLIRPHTHIVCVCVCVCVCMCVCECVCVCVCVYTHTYMQWGGPRKKLAALTVAT
jgi:hypothetical protein